MGLMLRFSEILMWINQTMSLTQKSNNDIIFSGIMLPAAIRKLCNTYFKVWLIQVLKMVTNISASYAII